MVKPDMDLFRRILVRVVEETPPGGSPDRTVRAIASEEGVAGVYEHVGWLEDAGFLEATRIDMDSGPARYHVRRVTKDGVDFYMAAKSDTVWNAVLRRLADVGVYTLSVAKELALDEVRRQVGLR